MGVATYDSSINSILDNCLQNCTTLTSITTPSSVTYIGYDAFSGCSNLITLTILENQVSYRSYNLFGYNTGIVNTVIRSSISSLGENAFKDCTQLIDINYTGTKNYWNNIEKGTNWNLNVPATKINCYDGSLQL